MYVSINALIKIKKKINENSSSYQIARRKRDSEAS
jgi:hypothetical protein